MGITSYSNFAFKCDWNTKNSQNVQNMGFFIEKLDVFEKKMISFKNC